jgi:hypothetical protein
MRAKRWLDLDCSRTLPFPYPALDACSMFLAIAPLGRESVGVQMHATYGLWEVTWTPDQYQSARFNDLVEC